MSVDVDVADAIRGAVALLGAGPAARHLVIAVSGGVDSMVLLHAAAAVLPVGCLTVATFDHGSGPAATSAGHLVRRSARALGLPCVSGVAAAAPNPTEESWRSDRWRFLSATAVARSATVVTGHTRDDQIETVFMRALRGAGPRGLAGLLASSAIARPLLSIPRAAIAHYAIDHRLEYIDDPSNRDRRHLRNRVRLDLLPALERCSPGFAAELLQIGSRAAEWRTRIEAVALTFPMMTDDARTHSFERAPLRTLPNASLRVLWPALAARAGVVMDRRGTERLARFTIDGETGQTVQLAGGVDVRMGRETITLTPPARDWSLRG